MTADMTFAVAVRNSGFETVVGLEIADLVAGRKIVG